MGLEGPKPKKRTAVPREHALIMPALGRGPYVRRRGGIGGDGGCCMEKCEGMSDVGWMDDSGQERGRVLTHHRPSHGQAGDEGQLHPG